MNRIPGGVQIIASMYYLLVILNIIFTIAALTILFFGARYSELWAVDLFRKIEWILLAVFMSGAVFFFFTAQGLRKGQRWARSVAFLSVVFLFFFSVVFFVGTWMASSGAAEVVFPLSHRIFYFTLSASLGIICMLTILYFLYSKGVSAHFHRDKQRSADEQFKTEA